MKLLVLSVLVWTTTIRGELSVVSNLDGTNTHVTEENACFSFPIKCRQRPKKIIWMYWEEGEDHLRQTNKYNYLCVTAWRDMNPNWTFHFLNATSRARFAADIEYYTHLTVQKRSDLLRLMLLIRYGGVWVDASVLPLQPLDTFIHTYADNPASLFMYRYVSHTYPSLLISTWLIYSPCPSHPALSEWLLKFIHNGHHPNKSTHYFLFHHSLGELYTYESFLIRCVLDALRIDNTPSHTYPRDFTFTCPDKWVGHFPAVLKRVDYAGAGNQTFEVFRDQYVTYLRMCFDSGWFVDDDEKCLSPEGEAMVIPIHVGDRVIYFTHHTSESENDVMRRVAVFGQGVCRAFGADNESCGEFRERMRVDVLTTREISTMNETNRTTS